MATRYFACDCIKSIERSFVAACDTTEQITDLFENCSDYMIKEITEADYNNHLENPS